MENEKMIHTTIKPGQQPTEAQIREIELASLRPIIPDDDAPELTMEQYAEMAALAKARKAKHVRRVRSGENQLRKKPRHVFPAEFCYRKEEKVIVLNAETRKQGTA